MKQDSTKFVGLDVSKESISVAVADGQGGEARFLGNIPYSIDSIRKLVNRLTRDGHELEFCYEAGPTGYGLYRELRVLGLSCMVVAPSLIPVRQGDRVKTDRRDALRLAQLLRAGELTAVWVPSENDEALRDLVRAREDAKEDLKRAHQRLLKFLLRQDIRSPKGIRNWTSRHQEWLNALKWENPNHNIIFQEYLHNITEIEGRLKRLEAAIHDNATESEHAPVIQALQTLRGVAEATAVGLVAEVGKFSRFRNPRQLMAYAGLVPKEHSSGATRWQGSITKSGNPHLRWIVGEAAWSYRYRPAIKGDIKRRQQGQRPEIQEIAWRAQHRLHRKYVKMTSRGKPSNVAMTAVARELLGFTWAIACEIEQQRSLESAV